MAVEVTVRDTETGETTTTVLRDYTIICVPPCRLDSTQTHANGTHVLTVKDATRSGATVRTRYVAVDEDEETGGSPCPQGCGGLTEDPYGGPCKACWDALDEEDDDDL